MSKPAAKPRIPLFRASGPSIAEDVDRALGVALNVDQPIERVVGRRRRAAHPLAVRPEERRDADAWRASFGGIRVARGVYRFSTHQEADEWLWRMIARPKT